MKYFFFIILLASGCQDYNSNSVDDLKYAPIVIDDAELRPFYYTVRTHCFSCHNYHQEWAGYTTPADWINARTRSGQMLLEPGNADGSLFIQRIINSGGSNNNMPIGRGPIPAADYIKLREWIEPPTP
jgi:hypothetical protein